MIDRSADERQAHRRRRRPYLWTIGAIALSVALVGAAWFIDDRRPVDRPPSHLRPTPVSELVTPSPLSDRERAGSGPQFGSQESVKLEEGAWVQVADAQGNLKQQYTASRIDPLPDKRFAMTQPRAVMYGDGGRIVTMRSDTMTARMPRRALESGRLDGTVVIRVYRAREGRAVDLQNDAPDVIIESPEAQFDMASGEIRCDRQVKITGEALTFEGEGLSLSLSQDGKSIERLVVDRPLAPVRFNRAAAIQRQQEKRAQAAATPAAAATQATGSAAATPATTTAASGASSSATAPATTAPPRAPPRTARAGAKVAPPATPESIAAAKDGRLFLLTLHDEVEVTSVEAGRTTVITGDRLDAYFMMRSGAGAALTADASNARPSTHQAEATIATSFPPHASGTSALAASGPIAVQLLAAAVAIPGSAPPPEEEVVVVRYSGRLVMAPAPEGSAALATPRAVRVQVTGVPARVRDSKTEAVVSAQRLTFESEVERLEMQGTAQFPASIQSPKFSLLAQHFTLDRSTGIGRVDGPGTIQVGVAGTKPLEVSWTTRMNLALAPVVRAAGDASARAGRGGAADDGEGSLRRAEFVGDVRARNTDFVLTAATLLVEAQPANGKDCPRRIEALGGVQATDLGKSGGRFSAQRMEIFLSPDAKGDAQARTLVATGDVMASDRTQTLWASALRLAFVQRAPRVAGANADRASGTLPADISSVVAEGPVELLLQDGARVFASRMEADPAARSARLIGPDVMVIRRNLVLDQLAEVRVQEEPVKVSALGAGRASAFTASVQPEGSERSGRPSIGTIPQMQATWRDALAYADGVVKATATEPARGLLLLQGGVKVRASRDAREAEALDADEVQIELTGMPALTDAGGPETKRADVAGGADASKRGDTAAPAQIGRMRAIGSVRMEARQWADTRRLGAPKLFRLNAPNIAYNGADGSAFVDGAGTLLVHDPPVAKPPERADEAKSPFSPDGTTRFAWKRSLAVARRPDGTSTITLEREVVMEHLGATDAAEGTGTVTADRMVATVRGVEGTAERKAEDVGMAMGGPAELIKVFADGRVVVRTPELDLDAGEFELDVPTQIGAVRAPVGRLVTVLRRGGVAPMRAHAFTWDLTRGTFVVEGARGTVGR